jgi:hypothetical protein
MSHSLKQKSQQHSLTSLSVSVESSCTLSVNARGNDTRSTSLLRGEVPQFSLPSVGDFDSQGGSIVLSLSEDCSTIPIRTRISARMQRHLSRIRQIDVHGLAQRLQGSNLF